MKSCLDLAADPSTQLLRDLALQPDQAPAHDPLQVKLHPQSDLRLVLPDLPPADPCQALSQLQVPSLPQDLDLPQLRAAPLALLPDLPPLKQGLLRSPALDLPQALNPPAHSLEPDQLQDHSPQAVSPVLPSLLDVPLLTQTFSHETDRPVLMVLPTLISMSKCCEIFKVDLKVVSHKVVHKVDLKVSHKANHKASLKEVSHRVALPAEPGKAPTKCHGITKIFPTRACILPTVALHQARQASNQASCSQGWVLTTSQALEITSLVAPLMVSNNKPC